MSAYVDKFILFLHPHEIAINMALIIVLFAVLRRESQTGPAHRPPGARLELELNHLNARQSLLNPQRLTIYQPNRLFSCFRRLIR